MSNRQRPTDREQSRRGDPMSTDALMPAPQDGASLTMVYPVSRSSGPGEVFECPALDLEPSPRRGNGRLHAVGAPPMRRVLEAILFAVDRPVTVDQLLCALPDEEPEHIEAELEEMVTAYRESRAGFALERTGGGWQLRTDPEMHDFVTRFLVGKKRTRLSRAAMETLAIIAYRQPITRGEMEEIRGVDCGQVLHTLLDRNLATVRGRSQALGRPLLYGTTEEFLHYFGINSLADLPSPEELQALVGNDPLEDPEIRHALEAEGFAEPAVATGGDADADPDADAPADAEPSRLPVLVEVTDSMKSGEDAYEIDADADSDTDADADADVDIDTDIDPAQDYQGGGQDYAAEAAG